MIITLSIYASLFITMAPLLSPHASSIASLLLNGSLSDDPYASHAQENSQPFVYLPFPPIQPGSSASFPIFFRQFGSSPII